MTKSRKYSTTSMMPHNANVVKSLISLFHLSDRNFFEKVRLLGDIEYSNILNLGIITAKMYIYNCRNANVLPSFNVFFWLIEQRTLMENIYSRTYL